MIHRLINKCSNFSIFLIILSAISDNLVLADIRFKSLPTTVKTFENDSALLPCYPSQPYMAIRWHYEDFVLADSRFPEIRSNPRVMMHSNGSLEVIDLRLNDTGEYICEVYSGIGEAKSKQVHAIEVQYSPSVITYPSGVIERELKTIFEVVCETRGVPYPSIYWRHNGRNVTNTYENTKRLLVDVQNYDMAGPIECISDNGVGEAAVAGITLLVLFVPDVEVNRSIIHAKTQSKVKLDCFVNSFPKEKVHWFFNELPVITNNRMVRQDMDLDTGDGPTHYSRKVHSLIIKSLQETDYGKYVCRAENKLGYADKMITLTGKPSPSTFITHQTSTSTSQNLVWQTECQTQLTEYKLKFRQVETGNVDIRHPRNWFWRDITIPAEYSEGPIHTKGYTLKGLIAGQVYEVTVQSRNRYGWSEPSRILKFATPSLDIINYSTETNDLNELQYSEDELNENDIRISSYYSHSSSILSQFSNIILIVNLFVIFFK